MCIVYRGIIDVRFGWAHDNNCVRFNQHTYDEHSSARAQNTGSCLSNETMTVVVKITTSLSTHVVVRPPSGG